MKGLRLIFQTLKDESAVAVLTGLIAFGILELLMPRVLPMPIPAAVAFAMVAAMAAAALDTLYFHLLYLLREAPMHMAEKRHVHSLEDARKRLTEGSIRLREALIRRFEADYQRTRATVRTDGRRSRRQLRSARQWLDTRLWVMDYVVPGDQLAASNAEVKHNPALLDAWTDRVDALVDARIQVQRREGPLAALLNRFRPAYAAQQTLDEWRTFSQQPYSASPRPAAPDVPLLS